MFGTPNSLHARIFEIGLRPDQMGSFSDDANGARQILNSLRDAYHNAGREELVKVVEEWRLTIE